MSWIFISKIPSAQAKNKNIVINFIFYVGDTEWWIGRVFIKFFTEYTNRSLSLFFCGSLNMRQSYDAEVWTTIQKEILRQYDAKLMV